MDICSSLPHVASTGKLFQESYGSRKVSFTFCNCAADSRCSTKIGMRWPRRNFCHMRGVAPNFRRKNCPGFITARLLNQQLTIKNLTLTFSQRPRLFPLIRFLKDVVLWHCRFKVTKPLFIWPPKKLLRAAGRLQNPNKAWTCSAVRSPFLLGHLGPVPDVAPRASKWDASVPKPGGLAYLDTRKPYDKLSLQLFGCTRCRQCTVKIISTHP